MTLSQANIELESIEQEIEIISKQIELFPKGRFSILKNGPYKKWILSQDIEGKKKKTRSIIPKRNKNIAISLAQKEYLLARLYDLNNERKRLFSYIKATPVTQSKADTLLGNPHFAELLTTYNSNHSLFSLNDSGNTSRLDLKSQIEEWCNEKYDTNPNHTDQLKFRGISGVMVRSKSELLIEQALASNQIPFRYENALPIGDIILYPDFTLMNPNNGQIIIWEHFGMMDNQTYSQNAMHKLNLYISNGYLPGKNLIVTYESLDYPLDIRYVDSLIKLHTCK